MDLGVMEQDVGGSGSVVNADDESIAGAPEESIDTDEIEFIGKFVNCTVPEATTPLGKLNEDGETAVDTKKTIPIESPFGTKIRHVITREEMDKCLLSYWYNTFKDITIQTETIILTKEVAAVLNPYHHPRKTPYATDSTGSGNVTALLGDQQDQSKDDDNDVDHSDFKDNLNLDHGAPLDMSLYDIIMDCEPGFATEPSAQQIKIKQGITEALARLGGYAIPKLMWKVPKDGTWMAYQNTVRCFNLDHIHCLLGASEIASSILKDPYEIIAPADCGDETPVIKLYLRKWSNFQSSDLFRAFICEGKLVAICQRDLSTGYQSIKMDKDNIIQEIYNFYRYRIYGHFDLSFYAMDVIRFGPGHIFLLDFNILDDATVLPFFEWDELQKMWDGMKVLKPSDQNEVNPNPATGISSWAGTGCVHHRKNVEYNKLNLPQKQVYGDPFFRFSTMNTFNV